MTEDWREQAFLSSLAMTAAEGRPLNLVECAQPLARIRGEAIAPGHLEELITGAAPQGPFLNRLGMQVHKWDAEDEGQAWTGGSKRSTPQRRAIICGLLGLDAGGSTALLAKRPIFHDPTVVITGPWKRWYTPQRAYAHEFYWPRYRDYLLKVKKWPAENVTVLDKATTDVVERLADPTQSSAYQSKGLVVGYVQSGKTANFTGVIAKAIDAGYRLIIVMTGTIEMLRGQTQRRIDKEMVGRQNITGDFTPEQAQANVDYQDDKEWLAGQFLDLGEDEPTTGIFRLTHHKKDYQKQFKTLRIDRVDHGRPLYDASNIFTAAARLVIVKKNAKVLRKLVADIQANTKAFAEIPVLIVDDESDLASVNTVDPKDIAAAEREGKDVKKRRAINERIATMLQLMPRAQYVAYTATPFANVFVDPSDPQGIFPKDFVLALRRPPGYMGLEDFHDLGEPRTESATVATSKRVAFVRPLAATEDDSESQKNELASAIDMFVLTGAVKLHRASKDPSLTFQHHTMLIHDSVLTDKHREAAVRVQGIWKDANFTGPLGKERLRNLYEKDLVPVSSVQGHQGLVSVPPMPGFEELAQFIGVAISKIEKSELKPVLVVNSDKDIQAQQQSLDFDRQDTWRILVGGAKLSRGFTVEGLTVTYFRRATNMSDSLSQMGRWFGFRDGYRDLVRLYIANRAQFGGKEIDIYAAFESAARDEAAFREQLRGYAEWDGDKPRLLPSQIPPLVFQHMPWLKPTARNKMFNAVITEQSEQPFTPTGYSNETSGLKENLNLWRPILALASRRVTLPQGKWSGTYQALVEVVQAEAVVTAMEKSEYLDFYLERSVLPKVTFYRRLMSEGLLRDFLVVAPQPDTDLSMTIEGGTRAVISRDRRTGRGGQFGEITEPKHRPAVEAFVGDGVPFPASLQEWASPSRGALLLYIAKESNPNYQKAVGAALSKGDPEFGLVVAYSAYVPATALSTNQVIQFTVHVGAKRNDPTVDVTGGDA